MRATKQSSALAFAVVLAILAFGAASAGAVTGAPAWHLRTTAYPSNFTQADNALCEEQILELAFEVCDTYMVIATNVGAKATGQVSVTIKDTVPPGLTVRAVNAYLEQGFSPTKIPQGHCTTTPVQCVVPLASLGKPVEPDGDLRLYISVTVPPGTAPANLTNTATVSAPGTSAASASVENTVESAPPSFGPAVTDNAFLSVNGTPDTTAGGHPDELYTAIPLRSVLRETAQARTNATSVDDLRDVLVDLPVGMSGSGVSAAQCTLARLASKGVVKENGNTGCPSDAIVGHIRTVPEGGASANTPIYNLVPEDGVAAQLGFIDLTGSTHVLYVTLAPTPSGYVLRTTAKEIDQITLTEIVTNIFGNPALRNGATTPGPYTLTNPSDCTGEPLTTTVLMDSWQHPGTYNADGSPNLADPNWVEKTSTSPPVTGCEALAGLFEPSITAATESTQADSPTGFNVNIKVPQNTGTEGQSTPPLRDTVVALPEGLSVNPSSANGLQACSEEQVGVSAAGVPNEAQPECPNASKVGTVELETPALPSEVCKTPQTALEQCPEPSEREHVHLSGAIYVARQLENPFGSLLALYIVVNDPRTGVIVKIPAEIKTNPVTGQLTTDVRDTPQFPFTELRTHFFGGNTAALRTPATCGTYTLTSELTPWSAPQSGPAATPSAPFEVTEGPGGGACAHSPGEEPNSPAFEAGTQAPVAGAFSPFVVHLTRGDGSQNFSALNVTLPPGATGKLAGIPQCSDAQIAVAQARSNPGEGAVEAASPSCPASSQIGTVTVGAGAGPNPFYVTGNMYLGGPYKGAPFSMAIITPAVAGPFDLGVVVVRAGLYINPVTAQVTAKSDPIPSILQGIPLDIRSVTVDVSRPGFTLNPTNCDPLTVTGQEVSTVGQVAPLSSRFQVGSCQSLAFKPSFSVSTAGRTSKAAGASLSVKVAYPVGSLGTEANLGRVDLQLPKQLPARLTTLQKACTEAQFNTNPAGCPVASMIGTGKAITPLLAGPLVGPAVLVSHGGAAFPDVEFLLQGEGVEVVLDGKTQIKQGITYSHFETVPDQPIATFEATFPEGKYSVLSTDIPVSAKNSLCGQSLTLPTVLTAQNGAVLNQTTKAAVTGCPKVKPKALTRAQKLANALKACRRDRNKQKRAKCVKQARKRYGPLARKKPKAKGKPKVKSGK